MTNGRAFHCDEERRVAGDWKGTCRTGSIFTRWETPENIFRIMRMIQLRGRKLRRREKKVRSLEGRKGEIQRSSGRSEEQEHFVLDNEREGRRCEYVFGQVVNTADLTRGHSCLITSVSLVYMREARRPGWNGRRTEGDGGDLKTSQALLRNRRPLIEHLVYPPLHPAQS